MHAFRRSLTTAPGQRMRTVRPLRPLPAGLTASPTWSKGKGLADVAVDPVRGEFEEQIGELVPVGGNDGRNVIGTCTHGLGIAARRFGDRRDPPAGAHHGGGYGRLTRDVDGGVGAAAKEVVHHLDGLCCVGARDDDIGAEPAANSTCAGGAITATTAPCAWPAARRIRLPRLPNPARRGFPAVWRPAH